MEHRPSFLLRRLGRAAHATLLLAGAWAGQALAADTPIATAPLFTSSAEMIRPNLMFILDNSGSMESRYLPDAAGPLVKSSRERYGRRSSHCNGLAYDPKLVYTPPVLSPGVPMPQAAIDFDNPATTRNQRALVGEVRLQGINARPVLTVVQTQDNVSYGEDSLVTVFQDASSYYVGRVVEWNASTNQLTVDVERVAGAVGTKLTAAKVGQGQPTFPYYYVYTGGQQKLGYTYKSNGEVDDTTTFYGECASRIGEGPGQGVFERVTVDPAGAEAQNFANWAEYYQTRMAMMKASVSLAVRNLGPRYRIGYSTINNPTASANNFLDIREFGFDAASNSGHKKDFFDRLWHAGPEGNTPLLQALARAGKYYAKKLSRQEYDPIQHSCQRNYALLSTDGYWNDGLHPTGLDGSEIGDADGSLAAPMRDGNQAANTLADVAAYYYHTDLRDDRWENCTNGVGRNVCENNVPGRDADAFHSFGDNNAQQHMTTFTLGLGVSGTLRYEPDYLHSRTGDFAAIVRGEKSWPAPGPGRPETTDDLWHAAVNGRGRYFSASDPNTLTRSLEEAFHTMAGTVGSASAASTSSLQPVAGDNEIFVARFTTTEWTGDLLALRISPSDGSISGSSTWSAREQLDKMDLGVRRIYFKEKNKPNLKEFSYANLKKDGYHVFFDRFCHKKVEGELVPRQCMDLTREQLSIANAGENLVRYLAGDRTSFKNIYRERAARLGDIINASPVFVGKPRFKYDDPGYSGFAAAHSSRQAVVLAAANDGMLHAFDRTTGKELWAYVPTFVLERMYRLADSDYATRHVPLVDGSPQLGDVRIGGEWRTIVVGGLNAGGRGYYALDVTDTANPKLLWEFEHPDLGLTFGNPVITKRGDGRWVVAFGSGYNNVRPGDGKGHLFVLDAATGSLLHRFDTAAGTPDGPSGLTRINPWVASERDNRALRFYGADLRGNLWRFDFDDEVPPDRIEATQIAQLKDAGGNPQPITTKPALGQLVYNGQKHAVVYVATGRYLGLPDLADGSAQSVYAIRDTLTAGATPLDARGELLVQQEVTTGLDVNQRKTRTGAQTPLPVDWSSKRGWRVDLPAGGERVSVDPQLALETLYVAASVPSSDACEAGGESFLYEFNAATGAFRARFVGDVLVQGLTLAQLTENGPSQGSIAAILGRSDGVPQALVGAPWPAGAALRRTSWRELVD